MSKKTKPPEKIHGIAHIFAAASYSWAGAKRLWDETAFRHETLAAALILAIFIPVSYTHLTLPTTPYV